MMKRYKIRWLSQAITRLIMVVILLTVSLCFALMQGGFVSWFIFFMLLPFSLYSIMLFFVPLKQFSIERKMITGHLEHGDFLEMKITLTRKSRFPLLYTVIQESMPSEIFDGAVAEQTRHFFLMGMKKQLSWNYQISNIPRGHHQLEGVEITIADFFGWVKRTTLIPARCTVTVYPKVTSMTYKPLRLTKNIGGGTARNTVIRDTTMVTGIREYQPGDRMSWIHWKTFAKTQNLQTKEFEDQPFQQICLVLDEAPSKLFEEQVALCASILTAVVSQHLTISFLSAGTKPVYFDQIQTEEQLQQAIYHLAGVQTQLIERVEYKFGQSRYLMNATLIYFVTSSLTTEWLNILKKVSTKSQGAICFLVRTPEQIISEHEKKLETIAQEHGIVVCPITSHQFANAFTEVMK